MTISWIVATHDESILEANLVATIGDFAACGDELLIQRGAPSITVAYAQGQAAASRPVRCYIHHDVQILDVPRLRAELLEATEAAGVVGVVGSREKQMPWWQGDCLGSVVDARIGRLDFGPGGECSMLDGLLLATRQTVEWDVDMPGWHGYDHDACAQMLARGLTNWCLTSAADFVVHNAEPVKDRSEGWNAAVDRWAQRWMPHVLEPTR